MLSQLTALVVRPDFFRRQEFTGGQALAFYSFSILGFTLALTLLLLPLAWKINHYFQSADWQQEQRVIQNLYPDQLVLTLDRGKLTANQAGPVVIPFPPTWRTNHRCENHQCQGQDWPTNLIVFDPTTTVSSQAFATHETLILANETEIGLHDPERGEMRTLTLSQTQLDHPVSVKKSDVILWVSRVASLIQTLLLLLLCTVPIFLYLGQWVGYLAYSLVGALGVWLVAHLRHQRLTYTRAYASTLYLLPVPLLVSLLMTLTHMRFPLVFTGALLLMAYINFLPPQPSKTEAQKS